MEDYYCIPALLLLFVAPIIVPVIVAFWVYSRSCDIDTGPCRYCGREKGGGKTCRECDAPTGPKQYGPPDAPRMRLECPTCRRQLKPGGPPDGSNRA